MLQVSLLLVSFVGYFLLLYILFKGRKTAFYPAILASGIITGSFLAGLLNILGQVFGFIYITGFVLIPLCIMYIVRHRNRFDRPKVHVLVPFVAFAAGAVVLYLMLKDRFIYTADDFVHWAKAARAIVENLRLTVEADRLSHGSYPPGSSIYIAYISYVVGKTDGVWVFAHALLLLSYWITLLHSSRNAVVQTILCLFIVCFMNYVIPIEALYVDTLLGAAFFACVMLCIAEQQYSAKYLLLIVLLLCSLVLIKSSAMFLTVLVTAFVVLRYRKQVGGFSVKILVLAIPFLVLLLWNGYYNQHFEQVTKHEISVSYYSKVLGDKGVEDVQVVFDVLMPLMLSPRRNHVLGVLPAYLLVMLALKLQGKLKHNKHIFSYAAIGGLVYEIGILLMYFFSMPKSEIVWENGSEFTRYNSTIAVALQGLLLYLVCQVRLPRFRKEKLLRPMIAGVLALTAGFSVYQLQSLQRRPFQPVQYRIENYPSAYYFTFMREKLAEVPAESPFIIYISEPDKYDRAVCSTAFYLNTADRTICYDRDEALALRASEPWKYYVDLCSGIIEPPTETVNIELFPRTNEKDCTNVLTSIGYKQNTRYSTTNDDDVIAYHWDISGYIPIKAGDVIRLKNVEWYPSDENDGRGALYWYFTSMKYRSKQPVNTAEDIAKWNPVYDEYGSIVQITVPDDIGTTTGYLRIGCQGINSTSVITVNEEIR